MSMHIVLTGGGSAGHVTPHLALLPYFQEKGCTVEYIGSKTGIEKEIITEAGLPYHGISSGKLRRYFSLKNFSDPFRILGGYFEAKKILRKSKPDVLFSKGGYVSVPVVFAAHSLGIPVVMHESDYTPGLANKLCLPKAEKICFSFEAAAAEVPAEKAVVTGAPVRASLLSGSRSAGLAHLGFSGQKPVLLIMGGSLGALSVNIALDEIMDWLLEQFDVVHIRGNGKLNAELNKRSGYVQYEYVSEGLEDIFAASDLMISRAGSNAIFELLALRLPNLLIPLPLEASRGDQILNARYFEKMGYSDVLMQNDITPEVLKAHITALCEHAPAMRAGMEQSPVAEGSKNVAQVILEVAESHDA